MDLRLFWLVEYGVFSLQLQKKSRQATYSMDMAHVGFIEATEIQKRLHESSLGATGLDSSYTEKKRHISHTTQF